MPANLPLVSCLCLTYARPQLLREAVWCFLQQDYPHKELVVVNDHPEPIAMEREYPGVRLLNLPERLPNLGQKRNLSVQEAWGEILLIWDDDDLYLPWRISETVRHLEASPSIWAYKPTKAWASTNNQGYALARNLFHSQAGFRREAFTALGGYAQMNSGQDLEFERRIPKARWLRHDAPLSDLFYVYRWGNGVSHISGLGRDQPGKPSGWEVIAERYRDHPGGVFRPGFDRDYWQDLIDAVGRSPQTDLTELARLTVRLRPYHDLGGQ